MNTTPGHEIAIGNSIMMPFFSRIFALYPDARRIQEKVHENERRFACSITFGKEIMESEALRRSHEILAIVQTDILPHLPEGYTCTVRDIFCISQDTERRAGAICQGVCDKFSQEETQVSYFIDPRSGNFEFTVLGSFHPAVQGKIRQEIMGLLPDEFKDRCSFNAIHFHRAVPNIQQNILARMRSLFGI